MAQRAGETTKGRGCVSLPSHIGEGFGFLHKPKGSKCLKWNLVVEYNKVGPQHKHFSCEVILDSLGQWTKDMWCKYLRLQVKNVATVDSV